MAERPNILVFLTDDHGAWAAGCYGNRELHTPAMDWLAATGARMDRAYTPSPVCSPARACFHTGRLPSQHGIHDWIREDAEETGLRRRWLTDEPLLGQLLQRAGYQTAQIGKWHCGHSWDPHAGFDRWFSYGDWQTPHFGTIRLSDQGRLESHHAHQSEVFTEQAMDFLRRRDPTRPFFMCVGYVDTHTPDRGHPERLVEHYRRASFADIPRESFSEAHGTFRQYCAVARDRDQEREDLAQYYAAVTMIDQQVGRVLDELEAKGDLANTLVIHTSDHGHMNGHHGIHRKGNATIPQNFLEEAIRVPLLVRWPERIPAGTVSEAMVDHLDTFMTLLDAAEAVPDKATREKIHSPGRSYLPMLSGQPIDPWRGRQFGEYGNARMVRTHRYKFIQRYPGPNGAWPHELYDLDRDPRERTNVIDQPAYGGIAHALAEEVERHFARYEVPDRAGRDIASQPRHNIGQEPWFSDPETV